MIVPNFNSHDEVCKIAASVLITRPWSICQKRIGTSWEVSHIGYNSESILGRNVF